MKVKIDNQILGEDLYLMDSNIHKFIRRPTLVEATQINKPFSVEKDGNILVGEPGDYLVMPENGEFYPMAKELFEREYVGMKEGGK